MNLRAAVLTVALAGFPAIAAAAPAPLASGLLFHKTPQTFSNPATGAKTHSMSGQGCVASHVNAAQTEVNPITGKMQAAPIVSIPITGHSGSVASATTRAQQAHACAHPRT